MPATFSKPFENFVAPARPRAQIWRTLLGLCLIGLIYSAWSVGLIAGWVWLTNLTGAPVPVADLVSATNPRDTFVLLATFVGMGLAPILVVRIVHRRKAATLFGRAPMVIRDFATAAGIVALVYGVSLVAWAMQFDAVPQTNLTTWLMLLPLAALGLLIQTGSEELVFRGYLQQQLAARFRWRIVWLLMPSLLFGAAHYDPVTAGGNVWMVVLATAAFGVVAADLTAVTGSIGAAWGFHFANNFAAILIIAVKGTIPGLALFTTPYGADDTSLGYLMIVDLATLAIAWVVLRRILRR